ncbi:TetR/AcrR family transcriptional regulator [Streptomyces sp. UNOC14_S4]|uniref:TetR/AcrR family transcriptional regulator n=1 Tax=Streptomyces sp. UNOC14_S4 TaxID=2872340 RepID=UPI001E4A8F9C|nr:TetR/AcrR family transcriptional regulator [Streptomyces sp. UNOC14_S4]MCC3769853.1 TetR/AcrR family transcriptional regulator [Streptomyces sp. UNOC14_S4]
MTAQPGLRERKKIETTRRLFSTAVELFLEHGFDNVTVAQIAAASDVSKMTVFNYFPTKEHLVLRPMEDHVHDAAHIVRERAAGETPVAALRRAFLAALDEHDASTGLNDAPDVLGVCRLLHETPALAQRALALTQQSRDLLAAELPGPPVLAAVTAAQLIGAREALSAENLRRLLAGESADAVHPDAVADAKRAFAFLETGLRDYGR